MEGMKNNKGEIDEIRRDLKKNLDLQDLNHRYLTQEEIDGTCNIYFWSIII